MAKQQKDNLLLLIQSLSKAEKRAFRIFANRQSSIDEKLFIQLFDYIENSKVFNEEELLKKYPQIKKSQLSNIKANLYKQLLSSLRLLYRNKYEDIFIRELIDSARILHSKGMYTASLDMLEKAKKEACNINDFSLAYVALDFERRIENQYITGSMSQKAEVLKVQSDEWVETISISNDLSNVSLLLYGLYLKYGYVKDKKDFDYITSFFNSNMPKVNVKELKFYDKIYFFQSHVWYCHMIHDFLNYFKYSMKWVDTFNAHSEMIMKDAPLYIKGLHNALNALYMANKRQKFVLLFESFKEFKNEHGGNFNDNDLSVYQLVLSIHQLNKVFLTGEYDKGAKEVEPLEKLLKKNEFNWDYNRVTVFYYKIACIHFGAEDFGKSLTYLNYIINSPASEIRVDIQCFARILSLIAHFELGNEVLVSYQIKSVFRFLSNMQDMQGVQKEILNFLRKTPRIHKPELRAEFRKLRSKLIVFKDHPYERRPFLYLDIISWLDSKINGTRIQDEIKKKIGQ